MYSIIQATSKALGTRWKTYKNSDLQIWNDDSAKIIYDKKTSYPSYFQLQMTVQLHKHKYAIFARSKVKRLKELAGENMLVTLILMFAEDKIKFMFAEDKIKFMKYLNKAESYDH